MALKEILESIKHPHKVTFESKDLTETYGKFVAQPFERGYAVTVGNALRRVLLSSIPGYAITAIKINGVSNEFENVAGMKEDTIVMIMHLKNVVVSLPDHLETKTIHIKKEGPCTITAGDFQDTEIKVHNPDYYIATIAEGYTFEMDLQVEAGYSYVPADVNQELLEDINAITIDAIYSPILNVKYSVEDVRVGQRINYYGKLILEIETKGNIAPDKALSLAASTTAFISFLTYSKSLSFNLPTLITISTSVAPFAITSFVSKALTSVVVAPKGNPITVQTSTSVPSNAVAATGTIDGFMQTEAKLYSTASLQSFKTSFSVASGFNIVWSIILAICALSIVIPPFILKFFLSSPYLL